ncbi:MAG: thioredoxin [Acidobacteriota bacterium]
MAEVKKANDANFEADVMQSALPVLVDFGAPWCGPCKQLDPIMDELAGDFDGKVSIVKVDIQESPGTAAKFGVMAVPTLLFVQGGEVKDQITGSAPSKAKLEEKLGSVFS